MSLLSLAFGPFWSGAAARRLPWLQLSEAPFGTVRCMNANGL
jgi:hypothetical protein